MRLTILETANMYVTFGQLINGNFEYIYVFPKK